MLRITNLSVGYSKKSGNVFTTKDLSLSLAPGSVTMIAGKNGSGKSSLMRCLCGLQPAISGEIEINGFFVNTMNAKKTAALVSIMLSTPPSLELITASEVVFGGRQRFLSAFSFNTAQEDAAVLSALEQSGSFHLASRYFSSLSDGEKQKIMFSRCLAQDTPVILMDEPLAFLDYPSRLAMLNMLKEIAKSMGKIILFSSHDLEISLPFCNQLLILNADASWKWISDPNEIRNLSPKDIF